MIILAGDTSANIMILVVAESEDFYSLHREFCGYLNFSSDCYLHFHDISSKRRKQLALKVATNIDRISRSIIFIEVIVTKKNFKEHSKRIMGIIRKLREKYRVDKVILESDFTYYLKKDLGKIGGYLIDDRSIEVQVADILANAYRRHRKIAGNFEITIF